MKIRKEGFEPWNKGKQGLQHQSEEEKERSRQYCLNGHAVHMIKCIKKISKGELKLRELVKILFKNCEFQHKVFNYAIDIALVEYKIAIEYDGWYHFNCQESIDYHNKRQKIIENEGWKFLRYRYDEKFPQLEQIKEDINKIFKDYKIEKYN